jgi:hypothetical protein
VPFVGRDRHVSGRLVQGAIGLPWIGLRVVVRQRYRVSITLVDECSVNTS